MQCITGSLAVLIFLSSPFLKIAGPVLSDISVMFFISLGLWVYLLAIKIPTSEKKLLVMFGFILFLAINSKEVGIILLELLIGLGFQATNKFDIKSWGIRLLWVFFGAFSGLVFFIVIDKYFIGDLWFHLRFTNWKIWFFFNTSQIDTRSSLNYFSFISSTMLLPVMILAYLNFFSLNSRDRNTRRYVFVGLLPLTLLLINTVLKFQTFDRYIIPIYPILAVLAAQTFKMMNNDKSQIIQLGLATFLILILIYLVQNYWIQPKLFSNGFSLDMYYRSILIPIVSIGILTITILTSRRYSIYILALIILLITSLVIPLHTNFVSWQLRSTQIQSYSRFEPFIEVIDKINIHQTTKIYISPNIYSLHSVLSRDINSTQWMINLFFRSNIPLENLGYEQFNSKKFVSLNYNYGFLEKQDWRNLRQEEKQYLLSQYDVIRLKDNYVLVLEKSIHP
jgi:hypothetical protein